MCVCVCVCVRACVRVCVRVYIYLPSPPSHLSRSLVDRWNATDDLATSFLHSSRRSAFLVAAPSVMHIQSGCCLPISFFCLPLLLLPCTVPCMIVLASPVDLVICCTVSVCAALLWSRGLRGAQWLAEFCFAPLPWR